MGKIRGAVEGIDNPAMARIALLPASLFRHDSVFGKIGPQPAHNRLFGTAIGLRNQIHFPLVADLCGAIELCKQDAAGFYGRLHSCFQELIAHSSGGGDLVCEPASIVSLPIAYFVVAFHSDLYRTINPLRRPRLWVVAQPVLRAK